MPRETIRINVSSLESYEAGAIFFSVMAYPDPVDVSEREKFRKSLCRHFIMTRASLDGDWGAKNQPIKPIYFLEEEKVAHSTLKRGLTKLRHRVNTATFLTLPKFAGLERVEGLPTSIKEMSVLAMPELGMKGETASTYKSKIWKPSRPVTHAAAAFVALSRYFFEESDWSGTFQTMVYWFLLYPDDFQELLLLAEKFRQEVGNIGGFPIPEDETIQFLAV